MSGRGATLHPGTYGTVTTFRRHERGAFTARAHARQHDGNRYQPSRAGETPEEAEQRLRDHLHAIGLTDARKEAVGSAPRGWNDGVTFA